MIVGLLILVALAAVAYLSWVTAPAAPKPECIMVVKEVSEWCLYDDGSVSEPVEYCVVSDPADEVCDEPEVTDLGEW